MAFNSSLGKILIVDDDTHIAELLHINLDSEGYEVTMVEHAEDVRSMDLSAIRLIIADASKQQFTGLDLLETLKADPLAQHLGFILCSTSDSESDIIRALDGGADDYIVKPFSLRELVARVRSVLRRHPFKAIASTGANLNFADISIDLRSGKVTSDGMLLTLSKTEYAILVMLMKNIDNYVTRLQIHREVWKDGDSANERIVDTNISRLRKKLGPTGQKLINRSGLGYMLTEKAV